MLRHSQEGLQLAMLYIGLRLARANVFHVRCMLILFSAGYSQIVPQLFSAVGEPTAENLQ